MLPSAVPLNRAGARPHVDLIRALAARLLAPAPVSARGVLLVQELLTDGYHSPLYDRERAGDLRPALGGIPLSAGAELMYDLAALAIAVGCFVFIFVLLYVLEHV